MEQMNASGTARRDGYYPNTMEVVLCQDLAQNKMRSSVS